MVGCVKTPAGLDYLTAPEVPADLIEVRLDELIHAGVGVEVIEAALRKRRHPALLTARASREGGARKWKPDERTRLLLRLLDHADAVDLELADLPRLQRVLSTAAQQGVHVILSVHALQQPASNDQLRAWVQSFLEQTAFCYKMAVRLQNQGDLHQLVDILLRNPHKRWALMGLGPDAPRSRGVLAGLGSLLVYGYLDEPTAPGQPSTKQLIKNL
ncbi:MAG: type I 3-dehydroquinate dehydratase [Verrucomicrobiota bacterium]